MIDLRNIEASTAQTVTKFFPATADSSHACYEAFALTRVEFDAIRRPSVAGWRHFLRLQGLDLAHVGFDLKIAAEMLARLAWPPSNFLELLHGVQAEVGTAPAVALPELHRRLLGHLSQLKGAL